MSFRLVSADDKTALSNTLNSVKDFPEDGRHEAYKKFGEVAVSTLSTSSAAQSIEFKKILKKIPYEYMSDFIWGVCLSSYKVPENKFEPFRILVKEAYPDLFYINWGFRRLGFKYYTLMINKNVLLENLSNSEKWYYSFYIKNFFDSRKYTYSDLIDEIDSIPVKYHGYVVEGIGKLIGTQMLSEPMHFPEYPLSLDLGDVLDAKLKESFYKGVGTGFCDIFFRACRSILSPEEISLINYEKAVEREWQRNISLMLKLPQEYQAAIYKGFMSETQKKHPGFYLKSILLKNLKRQGKHKNYLFSERNNQSS
jgi:hypothetical protein